MRVSMLVEKGLEGAPVDVFIASLLAPTGTSSDRLHRLITVPCP